MKRFVALLLILMLFTIGCGTDRDSAAEPESNGTVPEETGLQDAGEENRFDDFREDRIFITDLPDEELKKPSETVSSREDFIYALNYLAFYRIGDKVWFRIDPTYAEEFYNPYTEYQKAYEIADLADVYACQMDDSYYSEFGVVGLKYSMSRDIASEAPETVPDTPILPSFDYRKEKEAESFSLPIEEKTKISCENGEQLYYLAENGYCPAPIPGSIAEILYEEAKKALYSCTKEDQNDFEKIKGVYDWLTTEVRYDAETAYTSETYLVKEQAYYLEGVFLNRCAVCDGKAKAAALMLNMAGIHCVRTTGLNEGGDHAWNMVCLDGKWYIFCATYGQADLSERLGRVVPNYSMLLAGRNTPYDWYPSQKFPQIEELLEEEAFDIYAEMGKKDGLNLKISGTDEVSRLLEKAKDCELPEYKVEFEYTGSDEESFIEELTGYLKNIPGANAAQIPREEKSAFQIMILGKSEG